jgi:hypothetical protein
MGESQRAGLSEVAMRELCPDAGLCGPGKRTEAEVSGNKSPQTLRKFVVLAVKMTQSDFSAPWLRHAIMIPAHRHVSGAC